MFILSSSRAAHLETALRAGANIRARGVPTGCRLRHACLLLLAASAVFSAIAAGPDKRLPAKPPAVSPMGRVEGELPNGLCYTLVPHRRDQGRISLRLVVLAGSLDERDDERGFAHFIEHMAFNGTQHYPA